MALEQVYFPRTTVYSVNYISRNAQIQIHASTVSAIHSRYWQGPKINNKRKHQLTRKSKSCEWNSGVTTDIAICSARQYRRSWAANCGRDKQTGRFTQRVAAWPASIKTALHCGMTKYLHRPLLYAGNKKWNVTFRGEDTPRPSGKGVKEGLLSWAR